MRRGFTLIELLVVIAIIAVLAAILFPVFSQAKTAARKATALSNQRQIATAMTMYTADHDGVYPRNDGCVVRSSMNPDLNRPGYIPFNADGCYPNGPYPYRVNHYSWQKWLMPYARSVAIFEHPGRAHLDKGYQGGFRQWTDSGEIMGGFALNLALTGAIHTYRRLPSEPGQRRNSWRGGTDMGVPDPAGAMLFLEFTNPRINFAPVVTDYTSWNQIDQTVYPMAIREFWAANFFRTDPACNSTGEVDGSRVYGNAIMIGYVDGHAKAMHPREFLARTPSAQQYGVNLFDNARCGDVDGVYANQPSPHLQQEYPFWALSP